MHAKKTFREKVAAIFETLKLTAKAKAGELGKDDVEKVATEYKQAYESDFFADMEEDRKQADKAAQLDQAATLLISFGKESAETEDTEDQKGDNPAKDDIQVDVTGSIKKLIDENAELKKTNKENADKIDKLSGKLEDDNPKTIKMKAEGFALRHTDKYAFGIEHPMFSTEKRWNQITVNPKVAVLVSPTEADEKAFKAEVNSLGARLAARASELHQNNMLDPKKLMSTSTLDISEVGDTLGHYFVIRRTDALIARLLTIPTIYDMFPRRYGIQDMDVINNVLVGEVSQAWQKGKIFKGNIEVKPELGHVDDVSIKLQIEPLTEIERNYLGYLNTEGSDPVKWGMIEYYAFVILEKAIIEQNKRRVLGCYVKPETDKPGPFMNGSTGVIYTLLRYNHQYKMRLHEDEAFADYDDTNMLDTIDAFVSQVVDDLINQEIDDFTLVLNRKHRPWYVKNIREKFGKDSDFAGVRSNVFPNFEIPIYWMPALGEFKLMLLTRKGNVQCLENKPGEMLALKFEGDFEDVLARSRWKEGTSAAFLGKKFATRALLVANKFEYQQIYMNRAAAYLADDSVDIDGTENFWFVTKANTTAGRKITDITTARKGIVYLIECGNATKPQSIDKTGKFGNITEAWTPTAVGDYIMVTLNDAGDAYRELERCVAGKRTVNAAVQPTLPEAR